MNIEDLETRLNTIFLDNFMDVRARSGPSWKINPLNRRYSEHVISEVVSSAKANKRRYDEIKHLVQTIDDQGGISQDSYDKNTFLINSFVRETFNLASPVSGGYLESDWDNRAVKPSEEILSSFSTDGEFGEWRGGGYSNVQHKGEPKFEGVLYHRQYEEGTLTTLRVFNQIHRNSLEVKTIVADELVATMKQYLSDTKEPTIPTMMSTDDYEMELLMFNEEYEPHGISLEVTNDYNGQTVMVEIDASPEEIRSVVLESAFAEEHSLKAIERGGHLFVQTPEYHTMVFEPNGSGGTKFTPMGDDLRVNMLQAYFRATHSD